jgi:hypothetical protein
MSLAQPIAIATLTASILLTGQTPIGMRSWTQTKSLRSSLALVVILYAGTWLDSGLEYFALEWARPSLSSILLMTASWQIIDKKQRSGSIWASRRILPLTWTLTVACILALAVAKLTSTEFYAAGTLFAGFLHVLNIRAKNLQSLALFSELTMRISSLQAAQFSIQPKSSEPKREARDITLKAS